MATQGVGIDKEVIKTLLRYLERASCDVMLYDCESDPFNSQPRNPPLRDNSTVLHVVKR